MTDIIVNCDSIQEAIVTCKLISSQLFNLGIKVRRTIGCRTKCQIQTDHVFVLFLVCDSSENQIRGRCYDIAYGFGREDSLMLTKGKSERPTLPLVQQIVKIEKGERK